uniref:Uncharacterized protein n=1 Tax=Anguilla anguilla TaxID=7936 RepID=A0A0E9VFJ5_ANGAN
MDTALCKYLTLLDRVLFIYHILNKSE